MIKTRNESVPPEAIIRQLVKENNKLKTEIGRLKSIIGNKDAAISAFKKWQSKVAERKWIYWLYEGVKLMETPPEEEVHNSLKHIFNSEALWKKRAKACLLAYDQFEKAKAGLKKAIESSDELKVVLENENN